MGQADDIQKLVRATVERLTAAMRGDPDWADYRQALRHEGYDPDSLVLVSFQESDDCKEFSVLVTEGERVLDLVREQAPSDPRVMVTRRLKDVTTGPLSPGLRTLVTVGTRMHEKP